MSQEELEKLAERYQAKADRAYQNYQETGMSRYDRERRNNEDLATALRMAAAASDNHAQLVSIRVELSSLAAKAKGLLRGDLKQAVSDGKISAFLKELVISASIYGLCKKEEEK